MYPFHGTLFTPFVLRVHWT